MEESICNCLASRNQRACNCPVMTVVMQQYYQLNFVEYCTTLSVVWCIFSELSGIDGPFTPGWLQHSDGVLESSSSVKQSLLRVSNKFQCFLVHTSQCISVSRDMH